METVESEYDARGLVLISLTEVRNLDAIQEGYIVWMGAFRVLQEGYE